MMTADSFPRRAGFTIAELTTVLLVIGVLVALLLPAVQTSREGARRAQYGNNLQQLITAVHHYQRAHNIYPPGVVEKSGPIRNSKTGAQYHHSWMVRILPFLGKRNTWRYVDLSVSAYARENQAVSMRLFSLHRCPSSVVAAGAVTNYAGVHHDVEASIDVDNHGVFFLNSRLAPRDVRDGRGQTLFLGEKKIDGRDLGWMSGTRATLRNTGAPINTPTPGVTSLAAGLGEDFSEDDELIVDAYGTAESISGPARTGPQTARKKSTGQFTVGFFGSDHPQGAQFALGDGRVVYLKQTIDQRTYQQLGHRNDGALLDAWEP